MIPLRVKSTRKRKDGLPKPHIWKGKFYWHCGYMDAHRPRIWSGISQRDAYRRWANYNTWERV